MDSKDVPKVWCSVLLAVVLVGIFIAMELTGGSWSHGGAATHTIMEVIATLMALMVGVTALVRYYARRNDMVLVLGAGFIGTALLDGCHAIVTTNSIQPYFPSMASSSWNSSRTFLALLMLLSWLASRCERRSGHWGRLSDTVIYAGVGVLMLASFSFCLFVPLGTANLPKSVFARPEELVSAILFAVALSGYLSKQVWRSDPLEYWTVNSLMLGLLCQGLFMSRSYVLFDGMFYMAHLLKIGSYAFVLTGLMANLHATGRRENLLSDALQEQVDSLRATEVRFELCVRGSNDGIWDWNVETDEVYFSPRFKELLGFQDHEMNNRFDAWQSRLHPKDVDPTLAAVKAHIDDQVSYDVEYRLLTRFNEYRWFRARGQAIWDEMGKATRMAGSITDITQRKLAEEKLRSIASKLALPGESFQDVQSPTLLMGFGLRDMIQSGSAIRGMSAMCSDARAFSDTIVRYLHTKIVDDRGEPAFGLVRLFRTKAYEELDGELQAFAAAVADGQKLTPKMKCLTLIATAGDKPDWNDCTKSQGHRAIPLPSVEAVTELPMIAQLIGQLGFDVGDILSGDREIIVSDVGTALFHVAEAAGSPYIPAQADFVAPHSIRSVIGFGDVLPSGHLFAVICFSKVAIDAEMAVLFSHLSLSTKLALLAYEEDAGRVESQIMSVDRLIGNYEDVVCAQEKKLKQSMRDLRNARDEAEAASRAKSDFLANMSHEIRTPMNGVIGMTELVLDSELTMTQREYLETVLESSESLLTIINEVLDFSKIESGHFTLASGPLSLRDVIGETLRSLAIRAHSKHLELAWHVEPNVPDSLHGDAGRLRQIIVNLVGNAIKFTHEGEIEVDIKLANERTQTVELHFIVRDTGIGISSEQKEEIFQAFTQADMSTTRRYGGTGLGLAISTSLVAMMRGRIWVESQPPHGSEFHFTALLTKAPARESQVVSRPELTKLSALVVDDNATNRRILEELLRTWSIGTVSADSASAGLGVLRKRKEQGDPIHLVLSDFHMPEMDGVAFTEQIRLDAGLQDTIVILLTSGLRPEDSQRIDEVGFAAQLLKPVKHSELLNTILQVIHQHEVIKSDLIATDVKVSHSDDTFHVLVAEDGLVNQKVAIAFLEDLGHRVTLARDGQEALDAVRTNSNQFDLILMDVLMPNLDGFQATRAIREHEGNTRGHVPIVAMTAQAMKGDREACLEAGMNAYLSKPIRKDRLRAVIEQVMGKSSERG